MNARSKPDVLFDVDGVLVYPAFRFRDYLEREHGITPELTAPFFRGRFMDCVRREADLSEEVRGYLEGWGWPGSVGGFIETWMREDSTPDGAMLEMVAALRTRGFRCHVASVQERNRAAYLRRTVGFERAFDGMFFSCDVGAAKPDPVYYVKVQERLGRPARELLLVDDSRACIEAAVAAGWQGFYYTGPADRARLNAVMAGLN